MHKVRILVVEDERIVSMDIQYRLKALGYDVVAAAVSGEEAIEKAELHTPDMVLMDIMLDGQLDGIQAAEIIRARFSIPVIYLTGNADAYTLERAKVTEPFGYILKPFEERELHGHIEIALYKHRMELRLKESEERYMLATRGANDGLWDWDLVGHKIYFSPRWKAMLGHSEDDIQQEPREWFRRLHPEDSSRVKRQIAAHIKGDTAHFESEYRILCKDGSYRWMLTRGLALKDSAGKAHRIAGSQTDITERKVYDPLTGLPNRTLFIDRLQSGLDRCRRQRQAALAVLSVNLNDFRTLIDGLAYSHRDQLFKDIADRFQSVLQPGDTIARFGEESFGVLLDEIRAATEAPAIAQTLQNTLSQPFLVDGNDVYVHSSVGIALSTTGYLRAEELVRDANTAMHRAKLSGTHCEIFDEKMRTRVAARIQREADLRRAIEREELQIHYQPIVSLGSGTIGGFEALVRWLHRGELLPPKDFIPLAEQTGLIIPLERYVLRKSLEQMKQWKIEMRLPNALTMSVNLSAQHYSQPDLVAHVNDILRLTGVDSRRLKLEITETALMDNSEVVSATLKQLDALNVQLAMDDFGTGYSSLSYLHQFPIKTLKIDRCFVSNLGLKSETRKIVQTIVALGKNLGMEVTAEGVENTRQVIELQAFDCTYAQGYLFSKPLNREAAGALLGRELPWLAETEEAVEAIFK